MELSPYSLYRALRIMLGAIVFVGLCLIVITREIYARIVLELGYYHQYGENWRQRFLEEQRISVDDENMHILIGALGLVLVGVLMYFIYRQIAPKRHGGSRHRRRRSRSASF